MVTNDQRRRLLYDGVAQGLGAEVAEALLDLLPPGEWSDLVTRRDLERESALLRDLNKDMGELRKEMSQLGDGLRREMSQLSDSLRSEMQSQTRTIMASMAGMVVAMFGAVAGLAAVLAH